MELFVGADNAGWRIGSSRCFDALVVHSSLGLNAMNHRI
jgi:hypothetical protein